MSYIIDAREKAPLNAYKEMFVNRPEKSTTGLAYILYLKIFSK